MHSCLLGLKLVSVVGAATVRRMMPAEPDFKALTWSIIVSNPCSFLRGSAADLLWFQRQVNEVKSIQSYVTPRRLAIVSQVLQRSMKFMTPGRQVGTTSLLIARYFYGVDH